MNRQAQFSNRANIDMMMSNRMDADDLFSTSNMNAYDLDSSTMNQSYYPVNIKPASLRQDRAGQRTLFQ